jgi:hypothetical protein
MILPICHNRLLAKLKKLKWFTNKIHSNLLYYQYHLNEFCKKSNNLNKWYCCDSLNNKYKRMKILQNSMRFESDNIDLIVTSNNFFEFKKDKNFFRLKSLLNKIKLKKDLIIGVDYPNIKNPYKGISARFFYFKVINNNYMQKASIWEVYQSQGCKKNQTTLNNFTKQKRVIKIKSKSITLLSCGDILKNCHQGKKGLRNTNVYLSLAHKDFLNYSINKSNNTSHIQYWMGNDKVVIVSQQLSNSNLIKNGQYFTNLKYKLIYPNSVNQNQKVYFFDKNHNKINNLDTEKIDYMFIDIEV